MIPSLDLTGLLEQRTELREIPYSLDHQFIIKGFNSGTARWKQRTGQGMWEGVGASMLSETMVDKRGPAVLINPWAVSGALAQSLDLTFSPKATSRLLFGKGLLKNRTKP